MSAQAQLPLNYTADTDVSVHAELTANGAVCRFTKEEEEDYDDTKIVISGTSKFSRGELKVRMRPFGLCTAIHGPISYCWSVLKAS